MLEKREQEKSVRDLRETNKLKREEEQMREKARKNASENQRRLSLEKSSHQRDAQKVIDGLYFCFISLYFSPFLSSYWTSFHFFGVIFSFSPFTFPIFSNSPGGLTVLQMDFLVTMVTHVIVDAITTENELQVPISLMGLIIGFHFNWRKIVSNKIGLLINCLDIEATTHSQLFL